MKELSEEHDFVGWYCILLAKPFAHAPTCLTKSTDKNSMLMNLHNSLGSLPPSVVMLALHRREVTIVIVDSNHICMSAAKPQRMIVSK